MSEWIRLTAQWKLFWAVLQWRFGKPESEIELTLSPAEADVLLETATRHGWRALAVRILEANHAA